MEISETLYVTSAEEWRKWLVKHYRSAQEIWLVYPNKSTNKARIDYNSAVEEALCFGWIDSTVKKFDADATAQRFSPRNPGSPYSQPNVERLKRMAEQHKLSPEVQAVTKEVLAKQFVFPEDILATIKQNQQAWHNYQHFSPAYQRIRIAFIEGARKRPEEFQKRLRHFIAMTERNKTFGFGGIEAYY